jgi:hypothetical protein
MGPDRQPTAAQPAEAPPIYFEARSELAARFISGEGIEIGPLHQPLAVPEGATVRFLDRMSVEDLRREYPELADWDLVDVDIIDDGEKLETVALSSQDFIIANHFLEHSEDPVGTIETHLSRLKPGGILFYAIPDKRYTFDFRRTPTSLDHHARDHAEGPEGSRRAHYEEWSRLVDEDGDGSATPELDDWARRAEELDEAGYSIHMHVWSQADFLMLILHCRERFDEAFDIEVAARRDIEFVVVLRKAGPPPPMQGADLSPRRIAELEQTVHDLSTSASWRLTKPLRAAKRGLHRIRDRRR